MARLERIVDVQIALRTAGLSQQGFADILLVGAFAHAARVLIATSPAEVLELVGADAAHPLYRAALAVFSQTPSLSRVFLGRRDEDEGVHAALTAIEAESDDWYALVNADHDEADVLDYAEWTEAREKLFLTTLADPANADPLSTTSTAAMLMAEGYLRTGWFFHPQAATEWPDAAVASRQFTILPGGETYANQSLAGVLALRLPETTAQNVFARNGNTYEPVRNWALTQNGRVAGGEFIDVIRTRDALCEQIRVNVIQILRNNRVPFTDGGISRIAQGVRSALDLFVTRGGIAPPELDAEGEIVPSYTMNVPLSLSVPVNDKANRVLRDLRFTARLAGAIHATQIRGELVLDHTALAAG